jgi:hypothetical protein
MKASRGVLLVALALLAIAALRDFVRLGDALPWRQLYDFADFYCAGAALDSGADPYRFEPLHTCEHRVNRSAAYRHDPGRVVPAPLPPYDFPPFMLAARSSFSLARAIDAVAILLALLLAIWAIALCGVPLDLTALALVLPAGYVLLNAGQVVPFALAALAGCGAALALQRDRIAGILAALTLIEPHLGLPVCAALVIWGPRTRLSLTASILALALLGVWTLGISGVGEYVGRVLPAQAAAETGYVYQYSLTYLLRTFGASPVAALLLGELSYLAALIAGVWLGGRVSTGLGRRELLAYLPAACSVIGGPYVHMVDLPFAIPAALVLATTLEGRSRNIAAVALALLAVPWIPAWTTKKLFLASLFVVAAILLRLRVRAPLAIGTFTAVAATMYLFELAPPAPFVATSALFPPGALAQQAWQEYVTQLGAATPLWTAIKLPSWIALGALIAAALGALRVGRSVPQR